MVWWRFCGLLVVAVVVLAFRGIGRVNINAICFCWWFTVGFVVVLWFGGGSSMFSGGGDL